MKTDSTASQARPPANQPLEDEVLKQFRIIFSAVRSHFRSIEKQVGIGGAQVWALGAIQANPACSVMDLAAAMNIHQSTASNLIRQLKSQGLIAADKSSSDRRLLKLTLSEEGMRILKSVPGPFEGVLPHAISQIDHFALERLRRDLQTLIHAMGADESAATQPLAQL